MERKATTKQKHIKTRPIPRHSSVINGRKVTVSDRVRVSCLRPEVAVS